MSSLPPPGWYRDPERKGRRRFWDGLRWTDQRALTGAAVAKRVATWSGGVMGGLFVLLIIIGLLLPAPATEPSAATPTSPSPTATSTAAPSQRSQPTPSRTSRHGHAARPRRTDAARTPDPRHPTHTKTSSHVTKTATRRGHQAERTGTGHPAARGTALAALARVVVKGRAPMTGYDRDAFGPAWADVDGNGCDTRNDILTRDLVHRTYRDGCEVATGLLADPYTGTTIGFVRGVGTSLAVQIDHVVALGDAWQKGAQQWSASKREAFANDPLNLLAVDGPTNAAKGDGDAATWLPPRKAERCAYVARQEAVKLRYRLWMTAAEKAATARVLATCPDQKLPTASSPIAHPVLAPTARHAPTATHPRTPAPRPTRTTRPASTRTAPALDPRFGTCGEANDHGYGPYYQGNDPEYFWYEDRDSDGIDCEP